MDDAEGRKAEGFDLLRRYGWEDIVGALGDGRPVAVSVDVFSHWRGNAILYRYGKFTLPPETPMSPAVPENLAHAMCIVGCGSDSSVGANGRFYVVRNSWGTQWARDSPFGAGYGFLPEEYVRRYALEAVTFRT
jgi:hypothetical protein